VIDFTPCGRNATGFFYIVAPLLGLDSLSKIGYNNIMEYIIVFIIGFALGWFLQSWVGAKAFYQILKDLDVPDDKIMALAEKDGVDTSKYSTEEAAADKNTVGINVEKHGNRLYAYRSSDNEFLAYADSPEELFKEVLRKFQIEKVHISVEQGAEHVRDYIDGLERA
jgi:hypothetical protein